MRQPDIAAARKNAIDSGEHDFSSHLYVDRSSFPSFNEYLAETKASIFPIFGQAGIGKSWEMTGLMLKLPADYIPVFISARLAKSFISSVAQKTKQLLQLSGPADRSILDQARAQLPKDGRLIVFLDGINEYHFAESGTNVVKTRLWELFEWLGTYNVKAVVSCRSFTWQRIFSDEGLRKFMYVSSVVVVQKRERVFDIEKQEFVEQTKEDRTVKFGVELEKFSQDERFQFWHKVANQCGRSILETPFVDWVYETGDPFLCGIRAKQIKGGEQLSVDTFATLEDYVEQRCQDKSSQFDRGRNYRALLQIAAYFVDESLKISTSADLDIVEKTVNSAEVEQLINAGLVRDDLRTADGERVITFVHDRVLEFAVFKHIWRTYLAEMKGAAERACYALRLMQKSQAEQDFRDYYINIGRFIIKKCWGDSFVESMLPSSLSEAFLLVREILQQELITGQAVPILWDFLDSPQWGYHVAMLLRDHADTTSVLRAAQQFSSQEHLELARNSVLATRKLPRGEALEFLKRVSKIDDWVVRMRVAFFYGELLAGDRAYQLESWLSEKSVRHEVINAIFWAFEKMEHKIDQQILDTIVSDRINHWRILRYCKWLSQRNINPG